MSARQFTPGPWLIEPQGRGARGHWFQRESDGEYIAMSCRLTDRAEEDANAHLIAAAPELYEALEAATAALRRAHREAARQIREFDGGDLHCSQFSAAAEVADDALAKARGESL